ncbi:MAG: MFS transporter, partial [Burkholderiales bacterium]
AVIWYTGTFYGLNYLKQTLRVDAAQADLLVAVSLLVGTPFYIFFGWLSDRIGRRKLILVGLLIPVLTYFPLFHMLTQSANPALYAAVDASPVIVRADPAACSLQFDPVGKNKFDSQSCDVAKTLLSKAGVSYNAEEIPAGRAAEVHIGAQTYVAPMVENMPPAERAAAIADYNRDVSAALNAAGYPASADKNAVNAFMVIALLFFTQLCTAMVYGPMAAMLVELFPAKVRYTSMSLPYHIGNGWFGGLLPTIAFAIVASTGDIYSGIWYPVIIAGITFVVALFFLPETYKRNINHGQSDAEMAAPR